MTNRDPKVAPSGKGDSGLAPVSKRRITTIARTLAENPEAVMEILARLDGAELFNLAEAIRQIQRTRALQRGDLDELIAEGFEQGFTSDGLGVDPWIEGDVLVVPGGLTASSRTSHRCRFASIDGTWVWESSELIREDKRSSPSTDGGFRAVALLPVLDGMKIDVVTGKARRGAHNADRVISYEIQGGEMVVVAQRDIKVTGH